MKETGAIQDSTENLLFYRICWQSGRCWGHRVERYGTTAHFTTCGQVLSNAAKRQLLCQCHIILRIWSLWSLKVCVFTVLSEHLEFDVNQGFPGLYLVMSFIHYRIFLVNTMDDIANTAACCFYILTSIWCVIFSVFHNHSFADDRLLSCQLFLICRLLAYESIYMESSDKLYWGFSFSSHPLGNSNLHEFGHNYYCILSN